MNIFFLILALLFHCVMSFIIHYSFCKIDIYGDIDKDKINFLPIPKLDNVEERPMLEHCYTDTKEETKHKLEINESREIENRKLRQEYVEKVIIPIALKNDLIKELHYAQSQHNDFIHIFCPFVSSYLIFSIVLHNEILFKFSYGISLLAGAVICLAVSYAIGWIYKNMCLFDYARRETWELLKIKKYNHYDYLDTVKSTIYFRRTVRMFLQISWFLVVQFCAYIMK